MPEYQEDKDDDGISDRQPLNFLDENPRPWRKEEFPPLAEALEKVGPLCDMLTQISRKTWFTLNLLPEESDVACTALREPVRSLAWRATLRAGEGDWDGAVADCLTLWRISGLVADNRSWLGILLGRTFAAQAHSVSNALLSDPGMPPEARKTLCDGVRALPPLPSEACVTRNLALLLHREILSYPKNQASPVRCDFQTGPYIVWSEALFLWLPIDTNRMGRELTRWREAFQTLSESELRADMERFSGEITTLGNLFSALSASRRSEMLGRSWGIAYVESSLSVRKYLEETREFREEIANDSIFRGIRDGDNDGWNSIKAGATSPCSSAR